MAKTRSATVAIITRTKNRPIFLERAIKSVLSQTYKEYIHVILNDGGDIGDVEDVLKKYPDKKRVTIHNKKSVGLVGALNQAINAVDSEYICILDDDDEMHKDRILLGLQAIQEHGGVASAVPMDIVIEGINSSGKIKEKNRFHHPDSWCGEISLYKQIHKNYLTNSVVLYKRSVYDELGGYDESLKTAEDWDFGLRLMLKYNVEQVMSDYALVYYHQRPDVVDEKNGNSVYAGVREQERSIMIMRNNYLRDDLTRGRFGVGFIMNDFEQNLENIVRLEGHVNYVERNLKEDFRSDVQRLDDHIKELKKNKLATRLTGVVKKTIKAVSRH